MPTIPEMDEFVNWDQAEPAMAADSGVDFSSLQATAAFDLNQDPDLDLVLANVDGDDFSYWALEHFGATNPAVPVSTTTPIQADGISPVGFEGPTTYADVACANCQKGGYSCKTIDEGKFRGYCTTCVALKCECSFGLSSGAKVPYATFPSNPWPTLGNEHPRLVAEEDVQSQGPLSTLAAESAPAMSTNSVSGNNPQSISSTPAPPKVGTRFSREALKVLKNWLSTHTRNPYPTEEEKEMLQNQTGLNKTQITNWLANARRRNKTVLPRSTSPGVRSFSNPVDIPRRPMASMNPLERWQHSPPEHEPASVTDIARAITSSSTAASSSLESPYSNHFSDDGSNRSLCAVSTGSSANTSHSSSAFSFRSRGSLSSFGSRGRRRRRKNVARQQNALVNPLKTFQCTFCTETFGHKYDWQRHEKSLHLSLERWVCCPDGPREFNPENNQVCCVFCGEAGPDDAHIESHNHSDCQNKPLAERTFYRKDHLNQHLRLVHAVKFSKWSMESWRMATPEIRSRCGFCGIVMDTWKMRTEHIAEHFKSGKTMADWAGDWGFDDPVLAMVEDAMPPYLIDNERNSPMPFQASKGSTASPRNCYELLKGELAYRIAVTQEKGGGTPSDEQLQVEACRVIFGAEVFSKKASSAASSWLRDLLMSSERVTKQAQMAPIKNDERQWMASLEIIGKAHIFDDEPMEKQLQDFVDSKRFLGLTALDSELQAEACNILGRLEESSGSPCPEVYNFLLRLICQSTNWLAPFRQRAHLPRSEELVNENLRPKDPTQIDITIHNEKRLEAELSEYVQHKTSAGVVPTDADLQRQARMIIYGVDDGWNQTVADNAAWLTDFKNRHMKPSIGCSSPPQDLGSATPSTRMYTLNTMKPSQHNSASAAAPIRLGAFYLNDANCYRRLERELSRYVASSMSPKNPNSHVPSDEELQHQARWILYDSDDAWNQTAADNAEWLRRFKKTAGILNDSTIPGLPDYDTKIITQGGTGFTPPYAIPNPSTVAAVCSTGSATSPVAQYCQGIMEGRYERPGVVFCSRELEKGLSEFVTAQSLLPGWNAFPSDEELRVKAREIIGTQQTPADDQWLLERFKIMMREKLGITPSPQNRSTSQTPSSASDCAVQSTGASSATDLLSMPLDMDMSVFDSQYTDLVGEMSFDFDMNILMS